MSTYRPFALIAFFTLTAACSSGGDNGASSSASGAGGASASSSSSLAGSGGMASASSSVGSSASSSGAGGGASAASGTIVPLYTYPTDTTWKTIVTAKQAHPTVTVRAIINPSDGPGPSKDPLYVTGIASLDAAGIVVIGYVATTYGKKATAAAHGEIDTYKSWYPGLKGIFFDEMSSTAGDEAYYKELDQYAKGLGYTVTVGNPGTDTLPSFVGTVDTMLIYESKGLPAVGTLGGWHLQYAKSNFGVIPYGVPALDAGFVMSARPDVGFIYLTNDDLPNPWDSLPPYFSSLLAALE